MLVESNKLFKRIFTVFLITVFAFTLKADQKFAEALRTALKLELEGKFYNAAEKYLEARLFAKKTATKVHSLKKAAECFEKAGFFYEQFKCIERLLNGFPSYVDFTLAVNKEFEIGNSFYEGHRDPEYFSLQWIPWLTSDNKTVEIYEKAVKHAPFATRAPEAKLRLGKIYREDDKTVDKALETFRTIVFNYPNSESAQFAYLHLIDILVQLSEAGDGDGKYCREAIRTMQDYLKYYPKSKEAEWVGKQLLISQDYAAKRLYNIARFYKRYDRNDAATDYLNEILQKYSKAKSVPKAEQMLSSIDPDFEIPPFRADPETRYQQYNRRLLPHQQSNILIVPENSNGKYLLPIRDLGLTDKENIIYEEEREAVKRQLINSGQTKPLKLIE